MITFPNYVLKHLADSQQHNIVAALHTISEHFDSDKIDVQETLKFLTDTQNSDTENLRSSTSTLPTLLSSPKRTPIMVVL